MNDVARAVGRRWPAPVRVGFLDFNSPTVPGAIRAVSAAGGPAGPIVVPALLTSAYHGRVDLPEVLAATGPHHLTPVLGPGDPGERPDDRLLAALVQRLSAVDTGARCDGLVLIAAGTSHPTARSTVESVAARLGRSIDVECRVGYASASGPSVTEAVDQLRAAGAAHILAASYFLAPGRLYDAAAGCARAAGVLGVAEPLGAATDLVSLILARAAESTPPPPPRSWSADRELIFNRDP